MSLKTIWDSQRAAEGCRPCTVCDFAMPRQQEHINNEGQVPESGFCWHSNASFGSDTIHWSPQVKSTTQLPKREDPRPCVKGKNMYSAHNCTHTDLFTGEGAIILVVPSFSPFSMLAITRFMLFDPSNETKGKTGDRRRAWGGKHKDTGEWFAGAILGGWGNSSVSRAGTVQAWRPGVGSQNPCQKAKHNGWYLWSQHWGGGNRQVLSWRLSSQPASTKSSSKSPWEAMSPQTGALLSRNNTKGCPPASTNMPTLSHKIQ